MKTAHRKRSIVLTAIVGLLAVGVMVGSASGLAASPFRSVTAAANGGIPVVVNPAADLAAQVPGPELTWIDSIFVTGRVRGGGHQFGIVIHVLAFPNADQVRLFVGITDTSTGWYRNYQAILPTAEYIWSRQGLHITMPGLIWTGSARRMHLKATTPWGSLDARFTPQGPVLNYSGIGLAKLLGDLDYEYAFPTMRTRGSLTVEGKTRRISGVSWLDRQWGAVPVDDPSMRWTWMNITLSNGDQVAIWDILDNTAQNSWVTVLRPDGSYELAAVRPLARGASRFWTSPVSHNTYPTRWRIDIPALRSQLDVIVSGPRGQEFPDGHVEAAAAVTGNFKGRKVTGATYVEMTGDWKSPR